MLFLSKCRLQQISNDEIVTTDGNTNDANRRMPLFPEFSYGIYPSFSKSLTTIPNDDSSGMFRHVPVGPDAWEQEPTIN